MARTKISKIMAILALSWIIISIIWTWILFFMWWWNNSKQITKKELQKLIDENKIEVKENNNK